MRCDGRSLKLRMLFRSEHGQGGQGRGQKSWLDLASQRVGDARFGLECVHVVCVGGDGRRQGKKANLPKVDKISLCIRRDSSRPRQPVSPWRSGLPGTSSSTQWVALGRPVLSQPVMALFSLPRMGLCHGGRLMLGARVKGRKQLPRPRMLATSRSLYDSSQHTRLTNFLPAVDSLKAKGPPAYVDSDRESATH